MTFNSKQSYFLYHSKPNVLNCRRSLQQFGKHFVIFLQPDLCGSLGVCVYSCVEENWFTRVVILIWHSNIPLNAHHLESFVLLMAIHYAFQDNFMLSLNLTKHRNKRFPNAPYLCSRVWIPIMREKERREKRTISPILILGTFLLGSCRCSPAGRSGISSLAVSQVLKPTASLRKTRRENVK